MTSIRKFAYAALLAFTTLNVAPSLASAQEAARGKFTLSHDVYWGNAKVSAGDYEFSYNPDANARMLNLNKLSGDRTGYLLIVASTEDAKASDLSRLILETKFGGSYVRAMQLPESGMTLHFNVPSRTAEKQIAKASTVAAASVQ
ncbi:MAG TPA: hypothetical protein VGK96_13820 [Candidatus Sulfotelmatobacter sp.]